MPVYHHIKKKDGDAWVFWHRCVGALEGTPMSPYEIENFAARCIAEAYEASGCKVRHNARRRNGGSPHFILETEYGRAAVVVNYGSPHVTEFAELKFRYDEYGEVPRIIVADVRCLESGGRENIRGGSYNIRFTALAPLAVQAGEPATSRRTDSDVLRVLGAGWAHLDAGRFSEVLHPAMTCVSYVMMDVIPSAAEFVRYIQGRMDSFRRAGRTMLIRSVVDNVRGVKGILTEIDGVGTFMEVKIVDGYVTEVRTCDAGFLKNAPERMDIIDLPAREDDNLDYRLEAVVGKGNAEAARRRFLRKGRLASTYSVKDVEIEDVVAETMVKVIEYGDDPAIVVSLAALNLSSGFYERMSTYPVFFDGVPYKLRIKRVKERAGGLEAVVTADFFGAELYFFATDYCCLKSQYAPRRWGWFNLSALVISMDMEVVVEEHSADGVKESEALKVESRNGYYPFDRRCDEGFFNTELLTVEKAKLGDEDFRRAVVSMPYMGVEGWEIMAPLYYRAAGNPDFSPGDRVCGQLWLMGEIESATNRTYDSEP